MFKAVRYLFYKILLSNKKMNLWTHKNMNGWQMCYTKWKPNAKRPLSSIWFHLWHSCKGRFIEREIRSLIAWGWRQKYWGTLDDGDVSWLWWSLMTVYQTCRILFVWVEGLLTSIAYSEHQSCDCQSGLVIFQMIISSPCNFRFY